MEVALSAVGPEFAEAAEAAANGERVVVMKDGRPFVEMVPVQAQEPEPAHVTAYFERLQAIREKLGIPAVENVWPPEFDDPAVSRAVLGLDDE